MDRYPNIDFNQLTQEKFKGLVIKMKQGSTDMFPIKIKRAVEELTNFGVLDAEANLNKSGAKNCIVAGNYIYWLNR